MLFVCVLLAGCGNSIEKEVTEQLSLGQKYLDELDYEQAIAAYEAVLEIDPKNEEAIVKLIESYFEIEEYDLAISLVNEEEENIFSVESIDKIEDIQERIDSNIEKARVSFIENLLIEQGLELSDLIKFDGEGNVVEYDETGAYINKKKFYDEEGKITLAEEYFEDGSIILTYEYNENGDLVREIYPDGSVGMSYEYDEEYKLLCEILPSGEVMASYEYDQDGNLVSKILSYGSSHKYEYDSDNNLIQDMNYGIDEDGEQFVYSISYYDKNNNLVKYYIGGNPGRYEEYEYDENGNKIKYIEYYEDGTMEDWIEYNENGNWTKQKFYFDGRLRSTNEYIYDENYNRIQTLVTDENGNIVIEIRYDTEGNEIYYNNFGSGWNIN